MHTVPHGCARLCTGLCENIHKTPHYKYILYSSTLCWCCNRYGKILLSVGKRNRFCWKIWVYVKIYIKHLITNVFYTQVLCADAVIGMEKFYWAWEKKDFLGIYRLCEKNVKFVKRYIKLNCTYFDVVFSEF